MKFCFFGYDQTLDILQRLVEDGHEAIRVYTFACDNYFSYNTNIKMFCTHYGIEIIEGKISADEVNRLIDLGCNLFMSCGYPYKIPQIDESKAYGINLHPTLLPKARGMMPQPFIIMDEPDAAGFTIHKLTQEYDAGDILFQKYIPIDETTDVETLAARIAVHTPDAVSNVVGNLDEYWKNATPQDNSKASYYHEPNDEFRSINWDSDVETLLRKGRAFGRYGMIANIENRFGEKQRIAVFQFSGWKEEHNHKAGTLIRSYPREITIAVKDGYLCLKEFSAL